MNLLIHGVSRRRKRPIIRGTGEGHAPASFKGAGLQTIHISLGHPQLKLIAKQDRGLPWTA